ncbi:MAG: neutral/alkaline non-lysosomal ceramidase N-terminal domain-containing protein [Acidobacteria bacterium]|nr:neutral/alkaline non-lysosomal ceramidase N-terminal domain-containing protein [Acidobacteriota bacterium]
MRRSYPLFCLSLLLPAVTWPATAASRSEWKAGVATVDITPAKPIWMAGFAARKKPSEGVARRLYAKALALEDRRGQRVVIVTSDLLGFPRAVAEPIAERIGRQYRLRRDAILFSSSHTHSGPVVRESLTSMYALDGQQAAAVLEYTAALQDKVVEVAGAALKDLAPATLSLGFGEAPFAVNRRTKKETGYVISPNPAGPVDRRVDVLKVEGAGGRLRAVLFNYACHNTTLGGDNYQIHSDYAGVAQETLETAHPGVTALFMLGCGGDANPDPRGTMALVDTHGASLAAAVDKVLAGGMRSLSGPLRPVFDRVNLPFAPAPPREEWQARLKSKDVYQQRHARDMLAILDRDGRLPSSYPYPIQVVRFGKDLTMVALAGEVVVDYDLRLKKELGAERLWVSGYCNDVFAYIASKRVVQEGGYEAATSMIYYGQPGPWAPEVEEVLIGKVHQLVRKLK